MPPALLTVVLTLSTPPAVASIRPAFHSGLPCRLSVQPFTLLALTVPWLIRAALISPQPLMVCPAAWVSGPVEVLIWAYCGLLPFAVSAMVPVPESVCVPLNVR